MEIKVEDYLSEAEMKEIAVEAFKDKIHQAFGGDEYTPQGKEKDRQIKNAVAKWITDYVETVLTEEDKQIIREKTHEAIRDAHYEYRIFEKPDAWDRTEYTAYKVITEAVKKNEDYIKEQITKAIKKKFEIVDETPAN